MITKSFARKEGFFGRGKRKEPPYPSLRMLTRHVRLPLARRFAKLEEIIL